MRKQEASFEGGRSLLPALSRQDVTERWQTTFALRPRTAFHCFDDTLTSILRSVSVARCPHRAAMVKQDRSFVRHEWGDIMHCRAILITHTLG